MKIPSNMSIYKYLCLLWKHPSEEFSLWGGEGGDVFIIECCGFKGGTCSHLTETRSISFRVMGPVG